jgi:hypothetical protein
LALAIFFCGSPVLAPNPRPSWETKMTKLCKDVAFQLRDSLIAVEGMCRSLGDGIFEGAMLRKIQETTDLSATMCKLVGAQNGETLGHRESDQPDDDDQFADLIRFRDHLATRRRAAAQDVVGSATPTSESLAGLHALHGAVEAIDSVIMKR